MLYFDRNLYRELRKYEKIIIYGTGYYSQLFYPRLVRNGLKEKVVCFMQTKERRTDFIDGIPVVTIAEFGYHIKSCAVVVAVSEVYADEIKQILKQGNYEKIFCLSDYISTYKNAEEFYKLSTIEEYAEAIADWYIEAFPDGVDRNQFLQRALKRCRHNKTRSLDTIVMICGHMSSRFIKITNALYDNGYNIVVLDYSPEYSWYFGELEQKPITRYKCYCIEELLFRALEYNPLVYFFEPRWGDCTWIEIMIKNKKYFGKIIVALYDVLNDGYAGQEQRKLDCEKYALERADGIVWRWFSKESLERKGFYYQGKSIQFLDYCEHINFETPSISTDKHVIKLCQVTGFADDYFSAIEDKGYANFAMLDEILSVVGNREDCIFHFYMASLQEENVEKCRRLEKLYKNFKWFVNVEHGELIKRLQSYDYGCDLYTGGEWVDDDKIMPIGKYMGSLYNNGVRNIFFDYLSAGLPIVTTGMRKFLNFIESYKVVVKMDLSNLDIDFLMNNKQYYKEKVYLAKRELEINKQINRLINFFKEV